MIIRSISMLANTRPVDVGLWKGTHAGRKLQFLLAWITFGTFGETQGSTLTSTKCLIHTLEYMFHLYIHTYFIMRCYDFLSVVFNILVILNSKWKDWIKHTNNAHMFIFHKGFNVQNYSRKTDVIWWYPGLPNSRHN